MRSSIASLSATFAALAAAVALAGCGGGTESAEHTGTSGVETPVITGEPAGYNADDVAFATNMVPHHKQAIEMSALVPERSTDPGVIALADQITATQQPEINILNVFLVQWNENPDAATGGDHSGHGSAMHGMVDDATMAKLESLNGPDFDTLWLNSMVAHHRGAIEMAKAEIAHGENVDAISMAQTMVATQEAEIEQMKQMLKGGTP
ncbi:DUF305 domain-containing protein [Mycobacterium sp. Y57]|uniref:DUF305 domain-containing protein n=1 Tax=Mycolicibacterium xanthum TaxID=2796469 RepID=UPI001C857CD2|nr:DUF305 domain-containing protein [Mycolicibacterium xanthum]MBX7434282.1 DUF305 domain-containing protein [Mycolicibacterium xanthum]